MDLTNQPEFQLYLLTLHFLEIQDTLLPKNCDVRCVNATIINRAYYSAYLYCELWLLLIHNFKVKHIWEFKKGEKFVSEHVQVRNALERFGEDLIQEELSDLAKLRSKADYNPRKKIYPKDMFETLYHLEYIFSNLKFD